MKKEREEEIQEEEEKGKMNQDEEDQQEEEEKRKGEKKNHNKIKSSGHKQFPEIFTAASRVVQKSYKFCLKSFAKLN